MSTGVQAQPDAQPDTQPDAQPDAQLVATVARDLEAAWMACKDWDLRRRPAPVFTDLARRAITATRRADQETRR